jgi:hypothetical protein
MTGAGGGHITQEDLTLYALQALEGQEAAAVRAHLAQCAECRAALAEATGDLALLALTVEPQPLPAGARERFLKSIDAKSGSASAAKPEMPATKIVSIDRESTKRVSYWAPRAAAAALLVIALGMGAEIMRLHDRLQEEAALTRQLKESNARAQAVLDTLTAPAAQRVVLTSVKTPPAPSGRAVYLPARGALIFQANNMAALPADKTYELWVIPANGSAPIPAGTFRPDATGNASVVMPPMPEGIPAKAFGVTIEKASGSNTPTAPILMAGAAPAAGD